MMVKIFYVTAAEQENRLEAKRETIEDVVTQAQGFFASEMQRHGHGCKTFSVVTDTDGFWIQHHELANDSAYYVDFNTLRDEWWNDFRIKDEFKQTINIFFIDLKIDGEYARGSDNTAWGGIGTVWYFLDSADGDSTWMLLAHELGHAMGLSHDQDRDGAIYIMSAKFSEPQFSTEAAKWLSYHRALVNEPFKGFDHIDAHFYIKFNGAKAEIRASVRDFWIELPAWKTGELYWKDDLTTFEYAVLLDGARYPNVIDFASVSAVGLVGDKDGGYEYVYEMDFDSEPPSEFKVKMIGKYGQMKEVTHDDTRSD